MALQYAVSSKVTLSLCLIKQNSTKAYGEGEVQHHTFLMSALDRDELSATRSCRFKSVEGASCSLLIGPR
jgi:hypothetical protein